MKKCLHLLSRLILFWASWLLVGACNAQTPDTDQSPKLDDSAPVQLGQPVHIVEPKVPKEFRKKNLTVDLSGTISADGDFTDLKIIGGDEGFTNIVLDAVRQWHYSPALQDGKPVNAKVYVIVWADRGKVSNLVELDLPVPMQPREPIKDQVSAGQLFRVGGRVTAPRAQYAPDPEYSELARKAKYQGVCVLAVIVGADGSAQDVWVVKRLGMGLDQKAIDVVRTWKFVPATKDSEPVAVFINVEVQFRLY